MSLVMDLVYHTVKVCEDEAPSRIGVWIVASPSENTLACTCT